MRRQQSSRGIAHARAARALVVCVLASCALAAACDGGENRASPGTSGPRVRATVSYRVTGRSPEAFIRYGNKHHSARVRVTLPWTHTGSAFRGTTVILAASQPRGEHGYRLICTLIVTIPGHDPIASNDSSHIVGIKEEGGPQKVLYDGQCNTEQAVAVTGLP
jgi:hypothetical protein